MDWLGIPPHFRGDYRVHTTCKILSEFALEYRTTRERVLQTIQKKKAAREAAKKRSQASSRRTGDERRAGVVGSHPEDLVSPDEGGRKRSHRHHKRSREVAEDSELRQILGNDIELTENGTLRRKKKSSKEHRHHRHHHHHRRRGEEAVVEEGESVQPEGAVTLETIVLEKPSRRKSSRRHRPSMEETLMPLTEESFKSLTTNEMERGLLETLMATSDSSTLKRDKRRKSVKERPGSSRSAQQARQVSRSRTREIDADSLMIQEE